MKKPHRQLHVSVLLALLLAAVFLPVATGMAASYSITTIFNSDNSLAGNMFDVTVLTTTDVTITSFDVNLVSSLSAVPIAVYYRLGGYEGYETDESAWEYIGSYAVVPQGMNNPSQLPVGGVTLAAGETYGFYITIINYDYEESNIMYTNGTNTYADDNLQITCGVGNGSPLFGPANLNRTWNGTIYYATPSIIPQTGDPAGRGLWLYVPLGVLCISGLALLKRRLSGHRAN